MNTHTVWFLADIPTAKKERGEQLAGKGSSLNNDTHTCRRERTLTSGSVHTHGYSKLQSKEINSTLPEITAMDYNCTERSAHKHLPQ